MQFAGASHPVALLVRPSPQHGHVLVLFLEDEALQDAPQDSAQDAVLQQAQAELRQTQEYLQTVHEEYQATMEELRSANEELLSANEEYHSTLEELETSKKSSSHSTRSCRRSTTSSGASLKRPARPTATCRTCLPPRRSPPSSWTASCASRATPRRK